VSRRFWVVTVGLILFGVGLGAAAVIDPVGPVPEQVVEGHSVFTVLTKVTVNNTRNQTAAAVAILIQEKRAIFTATRFPGVTWFNDQYLVAPDAAVKAEEIIRYPCTGAVIAVPAGVIPPQTITGVWTIDPSAVHEESYHITDPNNAVWDVDKWNASGTFYWTAAMRYNGGQTPASDVPDDGECNSAPITQGAGCLEDFLPREVYEVRAGDQKVPASCTTTSAVANFFHLVGDPTPVKNPGENGHGFPCDGCKAIKYNALLYFLMKDLQPFGVKNHTTNSLDWKNDVSGCSSNTADWPCPAGNDDREGNSHPYNPGSSDVFMRPGAGGDNHGQSADCTGDGNFDQDCHETALVDIYYGIAPPPIMRYYVVMDVEGSSAPFHCHDDDGCPELSDGIPPP
jgi:hypothetical protein